MLNAIWLVLILGSILCAAYTGRMEALQKDLFEGAKSAVQLVIGLVGSMAFFLGLMRVAREGGLLEAVSRGLAPLLRRLFPDVPADHPAMGAMVMNLAANVLGLGNAATPFGLKAMAELDRLNPQPGVATNAMVLFLAINATSISLFPFGTAAVRAGAGSQEPLAIWVPTLIATTASTLTAVLAHFLFVSVARRREAARGGSDRPAPAPRGEAAGDPAPGSDDGAGARTPSLHEPASPGGARPLRRAVAWGFAVALLVTLVIHVTRSLGTLPGAEIAKGVLSYWLLPMLIAFLVLYGYVAGVRVYDAAVEGAREALEVALRIVPFLVVILVAVAMFRASGALDFLIALVDPVTSRIGFPAEALPMALLRPLSGSGAFGVMSEALTTHGPDSFVGMLVSTLQGSTETTFYVLAVYFGAAGVRNGRHCLAVCLLGDLAGFAAATAACHAFFG